MAIFRHPHLTRGIVHTPHGAFAINRGIADLPDEIGEALGWPRIDGNPSTGSSAPDRMAPPIPSRDQINAR